MGFIAIALLLLDWRVGRRSCSARSSRSCLLTRWFQVRSQRCSARLARASARAHRAVRRDDDRHPRRQGVPQGEAQRDGVRRARRGLPRRQRARHPAVRHLRSRARADRQRRGRRSCCWSAASASSTARSRSARCSRRCCTRGSFFDPMEEMAHVLQLLPVGDGGAREDLGRARGGAERSRPDRSRSTCGRRAAHVDFDDVEFAYKDDRVVLPDFDLDIPAGQTIALVGIDRCRQVDARQAASRGSTTRRTARVTLDGVDLRKLHPKDLRRAIVMVTQEAYLFSGTVADNIALGKPGRDARRDPRGRAGGRRATSSSRRCRTATTPT